MGFNHCFLIGMQGGLGIAEKQSSTCSPPFCFKPLPESRGRFFDVWARSSFMWNCGALSAGRENWQLPLCGLLDSQHSYFRAILYGQVPLETHSCLPRCHIPDPPARHADTNTKRWGEVRLLGGRERKWEWHAVWKEAVSVHNQPPVTELTGESRKKRGEGSFFVFYLEMHGAF